MIDSLFSPGAISAFALFLIRAGALVLSTPFLGQSLSFGGLKVALSMALALVLYLNVGEPMAGTVDTITWVLMAVRELMLGLFLGFVTQLAVLATRVAGEMIGLEMGMQMSQQFDPESGVSTSLIARIHENFFMIALLSVDGHLEVLRGLARTFETAPIGAIGGMENAADFLIRMLSEMLHTGLAYVAPVLVVLACVSALIGLLARAVPQLNVLELSFSLRIAVALVAMFAFAPLLEPVIGGLIQSLELWIDKAVHLVEA